MSMEIDQQIARLRRGTEEIITEEELRAKLERGKPLRVKLGIDPTAPDVHLGWAVVLRKLRQFQDLGHIACLIVGDFTAMIGDPTGKSKTRRQLPREEVMSYVERLKPQLFRILDPERTEVYYNADWLGKMTFADVIQLASKYTVARILEREDFANRLANNLPLGVHEILYPLCQGYDSVAIRADVELGGSDQRFNNLVGRDLQREYGQEPQVVMLMPLLIGLDGKEKMSQSLGNYIGISEPPDQMFGKVMSLPDELMTHYFILCTDVPEEEVYALERDWKAGRINPRDVKRRLAREIVALYHSAEAAQQADEQFMRIFSQRQLPTDAPEVPIPASLIKEDGTVWLAGLIAAIGFASSNSEARRLIQGGGVELDGARISDPTYSAPVEHLTGKLLRVGKHRFAKLAPPQGADR
ncbi:MAG: tyrosine--tRNA ligase [Fimbriimonadales bacterium]|jgi:tyrosyl-tRNA synthetase|nr:tyrosine--tRNA ligase [Fimbriimonadales bacterium]CUU03125.1 tyrosyl-tRNA synthetase [Armatimonadetes bacterium GBS]CUU35067.1 tyrosyl-tRNA synthetase [Armatimonadetes bacterium GXS]